MVKKFQLGGVVNPLSTLKPINIETAPKPQSRQPAIMDDGFTPTAPKISGTKTKKSKYNDDALKGALESDKAFLLNRRNDLVTGMQQRALADPSYYDNGGAALDAKAAQEQGIMEGNAKAKADQFKMLKTKFANSGDEIASDGETVLVKDIEGKYSIVPYKEAVTARNEKGALMYEPQSVSTALNLRLTDMNFSGYTDQGAAIENIIGTVTDSTKFNKTMQTSFKSVGQVVGDTFVDSVGNSIPMQDLIDSIESGRVTSNSEPLRNAVNNFRANLSSGDTKHLRTRAWEDYRRINPQTLDPAGWVEERMQDILESNALSYLKTSYAKGSKSKQEAADKKAEALRKEHEKDMRETIEVSELDRAKMAAGDVESTLDLDSVYSKAFTDLGGGNTKATFKTNTIKSDKTSYYVAQKKKGVPNDFRTNAVINEIGPGATLADGTPLSDIRSNAEDGYGVTMVPNSQIKVLHDVPMVYKNGVWKIAKDYMGFYSMLGDQIKKETANTIRIQTNKLGNKDLAMKYVSDNRSKIIALAKKKVLEQVKEANKGKKESEKIRLPNKNERVASKTVAMIQIMTRVDDDVTDPKYSYLKNFSAPGDGSIKEDYATFYGTQLMDDADEGRDLQDDLGLSVAFIPLGANIGTGGAFFNKVTQRKKDVVGMLAASSFINYKQKL